MSTSRKTGTASETAVVGALRRYGFPTAERRALRGVNDAGDIAGTPGVLWEVKGGDAARDASDGQITDWYHSIAVKAAPGDIAVLVVQRRGIGHANAQDWWAVTTVNQVVRLAGAERRMGPGNGFSSQVRLTVSDLCDLLTSAGYGDEVTL